MDHFFLKGIEYLAIVDRAPDKFNLFKPYLKTIQILADSFWLKNAKIYNNLLVLVFMSMSVCLCLYFLSDFVWPLCLSERVCLSVCLSLFVF